MTEKTAIYIGSYSRDVLFGDGSIMHGTGEGISRWLLDPKTGALLQDFALDTENPSYLVLNREGTMIYSVNELEEYDGIETGCVSSFRITENGWEFVNRRITRGLDPCHVTLTPDEKYLCASNYTSGSFCIFAVEMDGSIGAEVQFEQQSGKGEDPVRQEGPHCHSIIFRPDGRFAYVQNLGTDEIYCYRYSPEEELPFQPSEEPVITFDPGDGPRLLCFDQSGAHAYSMNELSNSVTVFAVNLETGGLERIQKVSSLTEAYQDVPNTSADIHLSSDDRFLYCSNRGDDSITVFDVDAVTGTLQNPRRFSCGGITPRNFAVDPKGRYLICANQDSSNVVVFMTDPEDGGLKEISRIETGSPVCVQIR